MIPTEKDPKDLWTTEKIREERAKINKRALLLVKWQDDLQKRRKEMWRHCNHDHANYDTDPAGGRGWYDCIDCGYVW
jgi:hypothetical protein